MANASASTRSTARTKKPAAPSWHELTKPTACKRRLWERGRTRTDLVTCGAVWDAVSIPPMNVGLDALATRCLGTRRGHQVLADHLHDVLYVAVPTGFGGTFADVPGVRVLSGGHPLLVLCTPHDGTAVADWVSHPHEDEPLVLVRPDRLAAHLRELATPVHEKAAVS